MIANNVNELIQFSVNNTLIQGESDIQVFGRNGNSPAPVVHFVVAFDILYCLGFISLSALLLTAGRSSHIKRASTWFLFTLSWLLTSLSNLIILGQQTGPSPSKGVCLMQAMLIYGAPVFTSSSGIAFLLQIYLFIRNAVNGYPMTLPRKQSIMIHALPCMAFTATLVEVLIMGLLQPETIQRDPSGMYCHLSNTIPSQVTAAITILAVIVFLVVAFLIFFRLRRKWKEVYAASSAVQTGPPISPDVAARVLVFSFCVIIAFALSFIQYLPQKSVDSAKINITIAVLPLLAGLIFGSQRDIFRVWMNFMQRK